MALLALVLWSGAAQASPAGLAVCEEWRRLNAQAPGPVVVVTAGTVPTRAFRRDCAGMDIPSVALEYTGPAEGDARRVMDRTGIACVLHVGMSEMATIETRAIGACGEEGTAVTRVDPLPEVPPPPPPPSELVTEPLWPSLEDGSEFEDQALAPLALRVGAFGGFAIGGVIIAPAGDLRVEGELRLPELPLRVGLRTGITGVHSDLGLGSTEAAFLEGTVAVASKWGGRHFMAALAVGVAVGETVPDLWMAPGRTLLCCDLSVGPSGAAQIGLLGEGRSSLALGLELRLQPQTASVVGGTFLTLGGPGVRRQPSP